MYPTLTTETSSPPELRAAFDRTWSPKSPTKVFAIHNASLHKHRAWEREPRTAIASDGRPHTIWKRYGSAVPAQDDSAETGISHSIRPPRSPAKVIKKVCFAAENGADAKFEAVPSLWERKSKNLPHKQRLDEPHNTIDTVKREEMLTAGSDEEPSESAHALDTIGIDVEDAYHIAIALTPPPVLSGRTVVELLQDNITGFEPLRHTEITGTKLQVFPHGESGNPHIQRGDLMTQTKGTRLEVDGDESIAGADKTTFPAVTDADVHGTDPDRGNESAREVTLITMESLPVFQPVQHSSFSEEETNMSSLVSMLDTTVELQMNDITMITANHQGNSLEAGNTQLQEASECLIDFTNAESNVRVTKSMQDDDSQTQEIRTSPMANLINQHNPVQTALDYHAATKTDLLVDLASGNATLVGSTPPGNETSVTQGNETRPLQTENTYLQKVPHDQNTDFLLDFLKRADATKAARIAEISAASHRRDSGAIKLALASPRKALDELDTNSPSPRKPEVDFADIVLKSNNSPLADRTSAEIPADGPNMQSVEGQAPRRSARGRLVRPIEESAPTNSVNVLTIRRPEDQSQITLKRSEAQELATTTRTNTRRNKGGAVSVRQMLMKISTRAPEETASAALEDNAAQGEERRITVRWPADDSLVYYFVEKTDGTTVAGTEEEPKDLKLLRSKIQRPPRRATTAAKSVETDVAGDAATSIASSATITGRDAQVSSSSEVLAKTCPKEQEREQSDQTQTQEQFQKPLPTPRHSRPRRQIPIPAKATQLPRLALANSKTEIERITSIPMLPLTTTGSKTGSPLAVAGAEINEGQKELIQAGIVGKADAAPKTGTAPSMANRRRSLVPRSRGIGLRK